MTTSPKLKNYLDKENIKYEVAEHSLAYTASEIAGSQHLPGKQVVKSIIVKSGDRYMMCVLPSIHLIDFEKLKKAAGVEKLQLASEDEIAKLFEN